ncbi:MAG: DUF3558 domain-containing protein [Mycobacterium sp.]
MRSRVSAITGFAILAPAVLIGASCTAVDGTAMRAPIPTNITGRPSVTFRPCDEMPVGVLRQLRLDQSPTAFSSQSSKTGFQSKTCTYRPLSRQYRVVIVVANYTLGAHQNDLTHRDKQAFTLDGRRALSYGISGEPGTFSCEVDVAATTGIFGVRIATNTGKYGPYADCPSTARHHLDAFLPYFPW